MQKDEFSTWNTVVFCWTYFGCLFRTCYVPMEWYQEMHTDAVCCAEYYAAWSIHYHLQWLSSCTVWFSEVFNLYHATNLFLDFIYSWLFLFQSELMSKCETQAKLSELTIIKRNIYGTTARVLFQNLTLDFVLDLYIISLFFGGIHSVHHLALYLPCVSHPIVVVIHGTVCASGFKHLKPCSRWWGCHIAAGDSGRLCRSSNWFYRNCSSARGILPMVSTITHEVRSHSLFGRNFLDRVQSQENSIHTWV